jgi:hypothetical protein
MLATGATNPPPAVGGAVLAAMLFACDISGNVWTRERLLQELIESPQHCLDFSKTFLDLAEDVGMTAETHRCSAKRNCWTAGHLRCAHFGRIERGGTGCAITHHPAMERLPDGTGL